jgi:hypothetical protein
VCVFFSFFVILVSLSLSVLQMPCSAQQSSFKVFFLCREKASGRCVAYKIQPVSSSRSFHAFLKKKFCFGVSGEGCLQ